LSKSSPKANDVSTCLKQAPDNLIFHLKRFDFDLNDLTRKKIHDYFAFPETLDISPYKFDHLADPTSARKEDLFDLVGVLVHTGNCENGHYYSYIRQRPSSTESTAPTWIEFNDSEVGPFDPSEIADRTFGGFTEEDGYTRQIKQYSAYMLFYQRRSAVEKDQHSWVTSSTKRMPQISIPALFEAEVNAKNTQFIREYTLSDPAHAKFVRRLHGTSRTVNQQSCSEDHDQEERALGLVVSHLGHVAWRQPDPDSFLELLLHLRKCMAACSTCCSVTLRRIAEDDHATTNILIRCTHPKVRYQTRELLIDSLSFLREKDPVLYGTEQNESDMEVDASVPTNGTLVALIKRLRTTADETWESIRGWEDYYLTLTQIAEMGPFETAALLDQGFLHFVLMLICSNEYPPFRNEIPELARIMDKRRGIFNKMICFLSKLLSQVNQKLPLKDAHKHDRMASFDRERMKFAVSIHEISILNFWSDNLNALVVVDKILEAFDDTKVDPFYPGDIIKWMLESPRKDTRTSILLTMTNGVQLEPPFCDVYVHAAVAYCEGCPEPANIRKVIDTVSQTIASPNRAANDRIPSGRAVLRFMTGLLKAENEDIFYQKHPHAFQHSLMARSPVYGVPLLCQPEDRVRKETYLFFQKLYANNEAIPPETVHMKYKSARDLLVEITHRSVYEREIGQHRSFTVPMVETGRLLVDLLYQLCENKEPEAQQFQNINDTAYIAQFQNEVEGPMRLLPHDMGTPMSQGEAYEQSDYGSESDDAHELLEI
jgi:ubiquitin carboxyl-terminal hydrolase 34